MKKNIDRKQLRKEFYERIDAGQPIDLAQAIKTLRQIAGKTQHEYAAMVNVSARILIDFERGKGNPTYETLLKLLAPGALDLGIKRKDAEKASKPKT